MRAVHLTYDKQNDEIYASTNRGTIQKFNRDLELIKESHPIYDLQSLYVVTHFGDFIIARDLTGKLVRWKKSTLEMDMLIDLNYWSDDDFADEPNVSHGLHIYNGFLFVSMPQGRIGKFKLETLEYVSQSDFVPHARIESMSTDSKGDHYAVDFSGYVYSGNISNDMKVVSRMAHAACHKIQYDKKYDRYWVTDDLHGGIGIFYKKSPKDIKRIYFTHDDVEWMSFSETHDTILVSCFDRYVYIISNSETPTVVDKIGPLDYQVTQVIWGQGSRAYAVSEAGGIHILDINKKNSKQIINPQNCTWDIVGVPNQKNKIWTCFESGWVRKIELSKNTVKVLLEKDLGLGMIRRILPDQDEGIFILSSCGTVARLDKKLNLIWSYSTKPLLRDFCLAKNDIIFCGETGEVTSLCQQTGKHIWSQNHNKPIFTIESDPYEDYVIVAPTILNLNDQGCEGTLEPANILICSVKDGKEVRSFQMYGNIKKINWIDSKTLLINGNGNVATTLLDWETLKPLQVWDEFQFNTCETALKVGDCIYTTTYGFQINTYENTGEILDSSFPFEDFPVSSYCYDEKNLVIGGRGGFLNLFKVINKIPKLISSKRFRQ